MSDAQVLREMDRAVQRIAELTAERDRLAAENKALKLRAVSDAGQAIERDQTQWCSRCEAAEHERDRLAAEVSSRSDA